MKSHRESLPRTTKAKLANCYPPIIDALKLPQGTPKCDSRQSCAHKPIHSKSDAPVCVRKCHTKKEPSMTVSLADISWMALS